MNMNHSEKVEFVSFKAGYTDDLESGEKKKTPLCTRRKQFQTSNVGGSVGAVLLVKLPVINSHAQPGQNAKHKVNALKNNRGEAIQRGAQTPTCSCSAT